MVGNGAERMASGRFYHRSGGSRSRRRRISRDQRIVLLLSFCPWPEARGGGDLLPCQSSDVLPPLRPNQVPGLPNSL